MNVFNRVVVVVLLLALLAGIIYLALHAGPGRAIHANRRDQRRHVLQRCRENLALALCGRTDPAGPDCWWC